jgi:hypothetical protein
LAEADVGVAVLTYWPDADITLCCFPQKIISLRYNRGMRFRKLRIAWSVFWGLAAVLMIVSWVRSYWWLDSAGRNLSSSAVTLSSQNGLIVAAWYNDRNGNFVNSRKNKEPADIRMLLECYCDYRRDYSAAIFSHWLVMLVVAVIGCLPWVRRFRIRTLLIATTALAALLGLLAYFNP